MRKREDEYKERVRQLEEWRRSREVNEIEQLDERRQSLEQRLAKSSDLHIQHLKRVASEAKLRNNQIHDKLI